MVKRAQGLHQADAATKKQKTGAPAVSEGVENVEANEEIIQFEGVVPNNKISLLYAIHQKYLVVSKEPTPSNSKTGEEDDDLKYINLIINTCDTILKFNERKKQDVINSQGSNTTTTTTTSAKKDKEPIDFIPIHLPNKVYHIYAYALFKRGLILLVKEHFLIRCRKENQIGKERALGSFEFGLEMLENSSDLKNPALNTDGGDAFFLKSWGNGLLLQNKLVTAAKKTAKEYESEMKPLIRKAKGLFINGLGFMKPDEPITEACWEALALVQKMGDNIYALWTFAGSETGNTGEVRIWGPNVAIYEEFLDRSTKLLDWSNTQYKKLEKKAISNNDKAQAFEGIAVFHLMRATPYTDEFDNQARNFEYADDESQVRSLQTRGKRQLEEAIKLFEKCEKLYADENKRNLLMATIAKTKLNLRDLLNEIDYLPGESKQKRATLNKLQEVLRVDAVKRLRKATRMGLGDFSDIVEELEYEGKVDDDE
ncbi:hypothetical protein D0Z00_003179 [Geotrichum galactomycetum]|uniref:Uncharacterized protein n=1 Tax=Geotrichum galactomycetum TaxID=27317 RepID=A0ACB6V237_9ASCO|nr:hypothetical protein D0Z00_003179 [Geotrichum candidum]